MDDSKLEAEKYIDDEEMSTDSCKESDSDFDGSSDKEDNHTDDAGDMMINQENSKQAMETNQEQNVGSKAKNKVSGLTRLPKMYKDFENSCGKKCELQFDYLGRFSGKYRSEFSSFLGDLVRRDVGLRYRKWKEVTKEVREKLWDEITRQFYKVDECRRKFIMPRLGEHLRTFRRKLHEKFILPNMGKPKKLKRVPKQYRTFIEQADWDKFVETRNSEEFKVLSDAGKLARSKSIYPYKMGRSGYAGLREKLVKEKKLGADEDPARSFMWRKARENDKGEYEHDNIKDVAEKLIENEKQIEDGSIKPDQGTDSLTLVFGKEHSGFLKGVGQGVTSTKYWHLPRTKSSSKEEIVQLKIELDNKRRKNETKDKQVEDLSTKLEAVLKHLASQGLTITNSQQSNDITPTQKTLPKSQQCSTKEPAKLIKRVETLKNNQKSVAFIPESSNVVNTSHINSRSVSPIRKCKLSYPTMRNIIAHGTVYHSLERQTIHGVPLEDDCYRVSVDESVKSSAFLPISYGDMKTVESTKGSFVAWPKEFVTFKEPLPSHQEKKCRSPTKEKRDIQQ